MLLLFLSFYFRGSWTLAHNRKRGPYRDGFVAKPIR